MTDVPEHQTPAEAARRHAIAALRARLDEIAEHARRAEASEPTMAEERSCPS